MPITIASNIASLGAIRQLGKSTELLGSTFERLSSGLRINKASDDAAGLAIATSLKVDTRVFNQGVRNLNDGISLLNIAEGALTSLSDIVIRLQELAQQSANGVNGSSQRESIDNEAQALSKEYFRITKSTAFNGLNLFDGSVQGISLQAGYGIEGVLRASLGGKMGTGNFGSRIDVNTINGGAGTTTVSLGDVNGDGILDMLSSNFNTDNIGISIGNGDGSFRSTVLYNSGDETRNGQLRDMNGDGSLDVVVVNQGGRSVSVLVGNGDGTFKAALSTSTNPPVTGAGSWGMDVGDVNGDGILDVVTGNRNFPGAGSVSVMIGRGDGTFNQATTMSTAADTRDVELADLNGDGNLDIISADFGDDQISIFLGNGNGTFQSRISMTLTDGPIKPLAEDINNDGKLDLIVANLNDGTVNIFIGNGDGTFQTRRSIGVAGAINVITGDLNEDGFIDMFVSGTTSGVLLGNGNGTFASIRTMSPGSGAWGAALGDLNSDGVLDIAVGVSNSTLSNIFLATTKDGIAAINPFSLSTLAEARQAISLFKGVADRLSEQKGSIGAFASRIKTSTEVLKSTSIAYQAAESRITDIDIAEETSKMIRQQILQQVSASILSQSKLQSEIALQLLR